MHFGPMSQLRFYLPACGSAMKTDIFAAYVQFSANLLLFVAPYRPNNP